MEQLRASANPPELDSSFNSQIKLIIHQFRTVDNATLSLTIVVLPTISIVVNTLYAVLVHIEFTTSITWATLLVSATVRSKLCILLGIVASLFVKRLPPRASGITILVMPKATALRRTGLNLDWYCSQQRWG